MNGVVVGDGYDHNNRPLDLTGFQSVGSTSGSNSTGKGWYVHRGGEIKLPSLQIEPGTHSYTWGDSDSAVTPRLVNSMRLTLHDQPTSGELSITLRTVALADALEITLPTQVSVVGMWQFSGKSFDPSAVDVLLRYNDQAANIFYPGESALQLIAHQDGNWHVADYVSRDELRHLIEGQFDGSFDYLVVAVPWLSSSQVIEQLQPKTSMPPSVSAAPEPCGLALAAVGAALRLLLRRRRTTCLERESTLSYSRR